MSSPMFDAAWKIVTKLNSLSVIDACKVITVTSAGESEGKSAVAVNVACAYAKKNRRVILIDANMRKPALHKVFSISNRSGLSSLLAEQYEHTELIRHSGIPNLDLITSGLNSIHPVELLTSNQMAFLIENLKREYDLIVIDTPGALDWTDAQIAASLSCGVLLVLKSGKVNKEKAMKVKALVEQVNARMIGVVLNA